MQNLKEFHRPIFKQTQDISILWSYFETQLRCHGNKFLKEFTKKLTLRYYRYFVAKFDHDWPTLT